MSRRGAKDLKRVGSAAGALPAVLEMCRHKLWMYLTLADVDICKAKEESLRKMMKEYSEVDTDLRVVQGIADQTSKLNCQRKELEEAIKSVLAALNKQVAERQVPEPAHATFLHLKVHLDLW